MLEMKGDNFEGLSEIFEAKTTAWKFKDFTRTKNKLRSHAGENRGDLQYSSGEVDQETG